MSTLINHCDSSPQEVAQAEHWNYRLASRLWLIAFPLWIGINGRYIRATCNISVHVSTNATQSLHLNDIYPIKKYLQFLKKYCVVVLYGALLYCCVGLFVLFLRVLILHRKRSHIFISFHRWPLRLSIRAAKRSHLRVCISDKLRRSMRYRSSFIASDSSILLKLAKRRTNLQMRSAVYTSIFFFFCAYKHIRRRTIHSLSSIRVKLRNRLQSELTCDTSKFAIPRGSRSRRE